VDTTTLASANTANGGAWWAGGTGTDKTNSAPTIYTDLVIDAVTNTDITSAASPFGASDVGNYINITGGTGFTVARYRVVSVTGVIARLDSAVGTVGSTGGTGRLGGALPSLGAAGAAIAANTNQRIFCRGTLLKTVNTSNVDGGFLTLTANSRLIGYVSSKTETPAAITSSSLPVVNSNSIAGTQVIVTAAGGRVSNIRFEIGASYRVGNTTTNDASFANCYINGGGVTLNASEGWFNCVFNLNNASNAINPRDGRFFKCTFLVSAISSTTGLSTLSGTFDECTFIRSDTGTLFSTLSDRQLVFDHCTFVTSNGFAFDLSQSANIEHVMLKNCLFWDGSTNACVKGVEGSPTLVNCAYRTAPSNTGSYPIRNFGGVLLTASPFTNAAGGDYSLTDTAKTALRVSSATVPGLPSTSTLDWIGALPIGPVESGGGEGEVTVSSETRERAATSAAYVLLAQAGDVVELQVKAGASGSATKAMLYFKSSLPSAATTGYVIQSEEQGQLVYTLSGVNLYGRAIGSDVTFVLNGVMAALP
jgi:hypothetical protein